MYAAPSQIVPPRTPVNTLHPDSHIAGRAEDLLNYGPFAAAVARGPVDRSPKDDFVVGVEAHWGIGAVREVRAAPAADPRVAANHYAHFTPSYVAESVRRALPALGFGLDVQSTG